jgi:choline dehydrogenase-like flavoprotein
VDCVIGSGPSGVAAAAALLQRGRHVRMVDVGLSLDRERAQLVAKLSSLPPAQWSRQQVEWLATGLPFAAAAIPLKLKFGSDYPYRDAEKHIGVLNDGVGGQASLAFGGLSTVWGAAMLPFAQHDIADWPISLANLAPHYEAIVKLTGLSAIQDDLSDFLPIFTDTPGNLEPNRQAKAMWNCLSRNRDKLRQTGVHFGRARLAIKTVSSHQATGCVYCGMCMNGCPYGCIYSSEQTVQEFRHDKHFTYHPDVVVTRVEETNDEAVVRGYHRLTGKPIEIKAEHVYLGCGVIPTTAILLRSLSSYDTTLLMKDSQYFVLPAILGTGIAKTAGKSLYTLSQLFIEILDPKIGAHTIHLQVYPSHTLIGQAMRRAFGPLAGKLDFITRAIEGRLIFIMGFLHSSQSSHIAITLRRESGKDKVHLAPVENPEVRRVAQLVARKLLKNSMKLGVIPISALLRLGQPGRGFHSGGTFPMRKLPKIFEVDIFGRPAGWKRVHAIDASILPTIPATTITLTVMANAHRIASQLAKGE